MNTKSIIMPAFVAFAGLLLAIMPVCSNVFAADVATNNPNGHSLKGALTSIQNDANGKPAWIVSGVFKIDNFNIKKIESPVLNATFYMIKLDGGSPHTHTISNFKMIGTPKNGGNSTTTINGTSTITMKEGPVRGVPTTIKIFDKSAISIMLDPSKVKNHFGSTPIYGTHHLICVEKPQYCK
jgi:hypothetical protein